MSGPAQNSPGAEQHPGPGLPVATVARRLGVAPATLRTWARRYGLGPSGHSAGTHRRYTTDDLRRLEHMQTLVQQGVSPADAARRAVGPAAAPAASAAPTAAPAKGAPQTSGRSTTARATAGRATAAPATAGRAADGDTEGARALHVGQPPAAAADPQPARSRGGPGGRVLALPGVDALVRGLGRAALALDAESVNAILRTQLAERGVVATWEGMLRPVLAASGRRWELTGEGVEVEHLLSDCIAGALRESVPEHASSPTRPVLLAGAPREQHALPLHVLAAAMAERGVLCRMLGPEMPVGALSASVRRTGAAALFLWSQQPGTAAVPVLRALPVSRPPTVLVVGGPGWSGDELPDGVRHARDLAHAVQTLLEVVQPVRVTEQTGVSSAR